ncbi:acetoacetate decarboxylase family protein [Oceanobacillus sp. CFH 90083]|uniref:acetoacetate decarboxylase family protein n=1 Tax=Oceanobacillus sp. CFH 90083 TaxID=2592336 RepID=UPI00128B4368|nr:acetoacetate decarboxylase family protein [Oceanobacillus sp. CFH 90083]
MNKYEYTILPEYSPLYPKLPYRYHDYQKVSVYCRGNKEALQRFLPKEFELTSDVFEIFILQNNKIDGLDNYSEGGVVIQCAYKGNKGACVAFEYVDKDDALCAGREIWGYPKKMGEVEFNGDEHKLSGSVSRRGKKIIDITFEATQEEIEIPVLSPRLQVKRMPHPEVEGTDINHILQNVLEDAEVKKQVFGRAVLNIEKSEKDPLYRLGVQEVIGAVYLEGAFTLTYGKVIASL